MRKFQLLLGTVAATLGVLTCLIAGVARVSGLFYIAGYQSTTLFNVGVGIMVFACLVKLDSLMPENR